MERLSDNAIDIINELHTERLHYFSEYIPLIDAANLLAEYEDTGLTPQEIEQMKARMPLHQWAGESPEKMSIFGVPVKKIMEWVEAERHGKLVALSCKEGDTIYRIRKFCEENTGYKEFYRPSVEFENDCEYFEPACCTGDCEMCNAQIEDDDKEPWDCSLNLDVLCEKCKERFAIQKDIFTFSKIRQIFNTPMFNKHISLEDIYYLSLEEAEDALKKIKGD